MLVMCVMGDVGDVMIVCFLLRIRFSTTRTLSTQQQ